MCVESESDVFDWRGRTECYYIGRDIGWFGAIGGYITIYKSEIIVWAMDLKFLAGSLKVLYDSMRFNLSSSKWELLVETVLKASSVIYTL
jgi:hypothetical protein